MNGWLFNPLRLGVAAAERARAKVADEPQRLTIGRQIALYVTVVLGVFASNILQNYQAGQSLSVSWPTPLIALIVGFVLLPGAVDSSKLNGGKEELVQFGTVFTYGMGWQTLLGAAIRAVGSGSL
jgi:hypothetical protein